jgi:phosphoglucomutase
MSGRSKGWIVGRNPPHGGPADTSVTGWIDAEANELLRGSLQGVKRVPVEQALRAATTHRHDYLNAYVSDLGGVIDMEAIRGATIRLGVDPLGGAGVHYWAPIAERYGLNLTVVSETVDPTFGFMTVDWDGRIQRCTHLVGEAVQRILSRAPDSDAPIGGVKVIAAGGWFAARPSGTEAIYKIYADSFRGPDHLRRIVEEAQAIVDGALRAGR